MKLLLIVSCVGLAIFSGSVGAAELPLKAPAPIVAGWTGCYVDGGVGYGMWNQDHYTSVVEPGSLTQVTPTATTGGQGWLGRVGAGCDYQIGARWVIGAFGDYDFTGLSGSFQEPFEGWIGNEKETGTWAVGGRIGFLVTPTLLGFLDAGYTQARFGEINLNTDAVPSTSTGDYIPAATYNGWFIGGGSEYALSGIVPLPGLFWRTEYRYASYRSATLPLLTSSGAPLTGTTGICDTEFGGFCAGFDDHMQKDVQTVTSGIVWRFNFGAPAPIATKY
jgi:outer membrane immunogenic protein